MVDLRTANATGTESVPSPIEALARKGWMWLLALGAAAVILGIIVLAWPSETLRVVGILFGWILGYLLCYGWSKITIFNPLTGTTVPLSIYYSLTHYVVVGGISLLCCAGAAYFPARKATRVQPVEIIRGAS